MARIIAAASHVTPLSLESGAQHGGAHTEKSHEIESSEHSTKQLHAQRLSVSFSIAAFLTLRQLFSAFQVFAEVLTL